MTRRIAAAVLVTSWIALLGAAAATYLLVKASLVEELDQSIITRASVLLSQNGSHPGSALPPEDRYILKNDLGQTLIRSTQLEPAKTPEVISRQFAQQADGSRLRTLTLKFNDETQGTLTIVYSSSTARFEFLQHRLLLILITTTVAGLIATMLIAIFTSRIVTRPLVTTAQTLSKVDEWNLNQRIDSTKLPVELHQVADRLNAMLARLEDAFTRQRQFMANAAHELRTPVSALRTGLEVALRRPRGVEELTSILTRSLTSAERLSELVMQLLEIAKSGQTPEAQSGFVDVITVIDEVARDVKVLADEKGVNLQTDLPAESHWLTLPASGFRSVIMNLLSNAVEYTPQAGKVQVIAKITGAFLTVEVSDTGCGISEDQLPRIFDPFFRAETSREQTNGHLGLGLYLTRLNVEKMGGKITATSTLGAGTAFLLEIPVNRAFRKKESDIPLMLLS